MPIARPPPYCKPSAAPVCMVVATTLAAAKIRKRSKGDCVRCASGTGERSAASTPGFVYSAHLMRKTLFILLAVPLLAGRLSASFDSAQDRQQPAAAPP